MTTLQNGLNWTRDHALWLALLALPVVMAACNNSGGSGGGY